MMSVAQSSLVQHQFQHLAPVTFQRLPPASLQPFAPVPTSIQGMAPTLQGVAPTYLQGVEAAPLQGVMPVHVQGMTPLQAFAPTSMQSGFTRSGEHSMPTPRAPDSMPTSYAPDSMSERMEQFAQQQQQQAAQTQRPPRAQEHTSQPVQWAQLVRSTHSVDVSSPIQSDPLQSTAVAQFGFPNVGGADWSGPPFSFGEEEHTGNQQALAQAVHTAASLPATAALIPIDNR